CPKLSKFYRLQPMKTVARQLVFPGVPIRILDDASGAMGFGKLDLQDFGPPQKPLADHSSEQWLGAKLGAQIIAGAAGGGGVQAAA
ncbi:MAG: hypothetical protein SNJ57_08290, partial [Cyanobacteriota bacterium]